MRKNDFVMPVRIEELVFKTTIKADREIEQATSFNKRGTNQPDFEQLKQSLIQELRNIAAENLGADRER